jgi:hypothetical protein
MEVETKVEPATTQVVDVSPLEKKEDVKADSVAVEKKEDPKHPPEGSPRWNEIYRKAKESERKVKQLERDMDLLRDHNKQLAEMKSAELELAKETHTRSIKEQIKDLRVKMKKAENELDWDNFVEYESQVEELKAKEEKKSIPFINQPNVITPEIKEETRKAVKKFTKENAWFDENSDDYDETMADAAMALDQRLMHGWDGTIEERFAEVKNKIEAKFNYKKNGKDIKLPSLVGGGNPPSGDNSKIELSSQQKRVVSMLFPGDANGEKKYLEQLKIIKQGKGEEK